MSWERPFLNAGAEPLHDDVVAGLDPALVRVCGDLDVDGAPILRSALTPLLHRRVELDLTEVGFIDSSGISALLVHFRHCQLARGSMTIPQRHHDHPPRVLARPKGPAHRRS
ncbi:STAS domain-containing protein [Streptomyces sp. WM6378]|uniref:STAS domain-containing protein n=1 Tax=Streptomyces sp. WM6378 TaxID=1415557 RepID=UPI003B63CF08